MKRELLMQSACAAIAALALSATVAQAATETILYNFPANSSPDGRLLQDSKGDLYGTATGLGGGGAIFRLKQRSGVWKFHKLFDFDGHNGALPVAGLIQDSVTPIFYGTTDQGGEANDGTVYSFAPEGRRWNETVLHSFSGPDGSNPAALLYQDRTTGNLYGTALDGGTNCGTVFQLTKSNWTYSTLHTFQGGDGCNPDSQLKPGPRAGTLVGATQYGGQYNHGVLFEMKQSRGAWKESTIYNFANGADGGIPVDLDERSDGTIFGVAASGGVQRNGAVFQLTHGRRNWDYKVIYVFGRNTNARVPLTINFDDATGALYGTTGLGGSNNSGTLFELVYNGTSWVETTLHSFGVAPDGVYPRSRPIIDHRTGVIYGTTSAGGIYNGGTVYAVQP